MEEGNGALTSFEQLGEEVFLKILQFVLATDYRVNHDNPSLWDSLIDMFNFSFCSRYLYYRCKHLFWNSIRQVKILNPKSLKLIWRGNHTHLIPFEMVYNRTAQSRKMKLLKLCIMRCCSLQEIRYMDEHHERRCTSKWEINKRRRPPTLPTLLVHQTMTTSRTVEKIFSKNISK